MICEQVDNANEVDPIRYKGKCSEVQCCAMLCRVLPDDDVMSRWLP